MKQKKQDKAEAIVKKIKLAKKENDTGNALKKTAPAIELKDLVIDFGETLAVDSINAKFKEGEMVTLLGPSGCGKTTTLNAIAGLLTPTSGRILFKGKDVTKDAPQKRKLGLVFQNYALYPHMSVYKNIAFPLTNDARWKFSVKKKNAIAKLEREKIVLSSNGATPKEIEHLAKAFFTSYDVRHEAEFQFEQLSAEQSTVLIAAKNEVTLASVRADAQIAKLSRKLLEKLKGADKETKKELQEKFKLESAKIKTQKATALAKAKADYKEVVAQNKASGISETIKKAKSDVRVLSSKSKQYYLNLRKELVGKYSLKTENLSEKQKAAYDKHGEKIIKMSEAIRREVFAVAEKVDIVKNLKKKPTKLSGGQQQRVAIARGIVKKPKVLLMDEPLSNLDAKLRIATREWIKEIQKELGITTVFVTHDQEEAMSISDTIICMSNGEIQQIGSPMELYENPKNEFVARFLGMPEMNMFKGEVTSTGAVKVGKTEVAKVAKTNAGKKVSVGFRAEHAKVGKTGIEATILDVELLGRETLASVEFVESGTKGKIFLPTTSKQAKGSTIYVQPGKAYVFNANTGVVL